MNAVKSTLGALAVLFIFGLLFGTPDWFSTEEVAVSTPQEGTALPLPDEARTSAVPDWAPPGFGSDVEGERRTSELASADVEVSVLIRDWQGVQHRELDGQLLVRTRAGETATAVIEDGSCFLPNTGQEVPRVVELVSNGRAASVRELDWSTRPATLVADWVYPVSLSVRSADDGEHLTGLRVLEESVQSPGSGPLPPPGARRLALTEGDGSPTVVGPFPLERALWVGAEGYGWKRVLAGPLCRELEVELDPGGRLEVALRGDLKVLGELGIRIVRDGELLLQQRCDGRERIEISGLEASTYEVHLDYMKTRLIWSNVETRSVRVQDGGVSRVDFACSDLPLPHAGEVWITVQLPEGAWRQHARVRFQPLGVPSAAVELSTNRFDTLGGGAYSAHLRSLQPGTWTATVLPWDTGIEFEVEPGAITAERIDLSGLVPARVEVVDAETGGPAETWGLNWRPVEPNGPTRTAWSVLVQDPLEESFVVWAYPGLIEIEALGTEVSTVDSLFLHDGSSQHRLQVESVRHSSLSISLVSESGVQLRPLEEWSHLTLRRFDGSPVGVFKTFPDLVRGAAMGAWRSELLVPEDGDFVLEIAPELSGGEPITIPVEVRSGVPASYTIDLHS